MKKKIIESRSGFSNTIKRSFDISVATFILIVMLPILVLATLGIYLTSKGPIFYKAKRAGLNGQAFSMLKFRSMHIGSDLKGAITSPNDKRVFPLGVFLRKYKIDELPQFYNVIKGDMSIVGPRPEDLTIVSEHYTNWMLETLSVRPGLTSPGAIFGYAFGNDLLTDSDTLVNYVEFLLPKKLALERAYIERANFLSDLEYIARTVLAIVYVGADMKVVIPRHDVQAAQKWASI